LYERAHIIRYFPRLPQVYFANHPSKFAAKQADTAMGC
jgi:hypothetical protein